MKPAPSNFALFDPQGGAAHMPVYTTNNTYFQNYIRGPYGMYDVQLKPFSPLVNADVNDEVRQCYINTGNPEGCANHATKLIHARSRGNVNKVNVSYSTGAHSSIHAMHNPTCRCPYPVLNAKPSCNCSF